ncbi:MAG TPA: hypothetical protein ENI82_01960 [Bacteroidetes bacterium]|nr:hypothetical protein [Bacteroidota bacterium]
MKRNPIHHIYSQLRIAEAAAAGISDTTSDKASVIEKFDGHPTPRLHEENKEIVANKATREIRFLNFLVFIS